MLHIATGEWNTEASGTQVFVDQIIEIAPELDFTFAGGTHGIFLRPSYLFMPEKGNLGHLIGGQLGYRFNL